MMAGMHGRIGLAVLAGLGLASSAVAFGGRAPRPGATAVVAAYPVTYVHAVPAWSYTPVVPYYCPAPVIVPRPALAVPTPAPPSRVLPAVTVPQTVAPQTVVPQSTEPPVQKSTMPPAGPGAGPAPAEKRAPVITESRRADTTASASSDGRCKVGFWNLTGRDVTVTVDGTPRPLPKDRAITLELGRSFRWQMDDGPARTESVPDSQTTHEVVLQTTTAGR